MTGAEHPRRQTMWEWLSRLLARRRVHRDIEAGGYCSDDEAVARWSTYVRHMLGSHDT